MKIPPGLLSFLLLLTTCAFAYLMVRQCSEKQAAHDAAVQLRADSTVIANKERETALRLSDTALRLSDKEKDDAEAAVKAAQDAADREARDNQIMMLIGNMSRPQQDNTALKYLIEGGFLSRDRYRDTLLVRAGGTVKKDSLYVAGVAAQGQVLSETRTQLDQTNTVLRKSQNDVSDLEKVLNDQYANIGDTRMYVQDRVAERGVLRGKSKKQFREVDRQLSEIQKQAKRKRAP